MTNNDLLTIRFADEFEKELYQLSKKYRNIRQDVEPVINQLQQGIFLGERYKKILQLMILILF